MGCESSYKKYLREEIERLEIKLKNTNDPKLKNGIYREIKLIRNRINLHVKASCYGRDL
jgi:hypothetical protein